MQGITKIYRETELRANDDVTLNVEEREIHAIVGENGAGKTTLMKVLYGLEPPDEGRIFLKGEEVDIANPLAANRLGIGMVHQHFTLIPEFTVSENVVLGIEPMKRGVFFDRETAIKEVSKVIDEHEFPLNPKTRVRDLTVGQMQQVEIIKMLYRKVELLILDEPTSVLTEQEILKLFQNLKRLVAGGKTCILITHKLDEVMEISDRVTVMRKGKVVAVRNTADVDSRELSRLMVGKSILFDFEKEEREHGRVVVELKDVTLRKKGQERPLLDHLNLSIHTGEIVGVAGVGGNGLGELEDVITGLRKIHEGHILHDGKDVTNIGAISLRENGLAYVPADRLFRGSSLQSTIRENMIVTNPRRFLKAGFFDRKKIYDYAKDLTEQFSIDGTPDLPIGMLSGGNIQKVILARELANKTDFIVFSEPTWGLDVAGAEFIYKKILEIRTSGTGVMLISSNLDEILGLADRIVVMYRGKIVANLENRGVSKETIGEYMLGIRDDYTRKTVGTT